MGNLLRRHKSVLRCSIFLIAVVSASGRGGVAGDSVSALTTAGEAVRTFLGEEVVFDRYIFRPGPFPAVRWNNPDAVQNTVGLVPLTVEYYNRSFSRVDRAETPGRYGAVVRGVTARGFPIVRYVTIYCSSFRFDDYGPDVPLVLQSLPGFGIPSEHWELYRKNLRRFSFGSLLLFPEHDPDAAIFLAGLADVTPKSPPRLTPRLIDRQWWITFKRRTDGAPHPAVELLLRSPEHPVPVLGEMAARDYNSLTSAERKGLIEICRAWYDSTGVPLTALIVQKDRVIFHEAFGKTNDGKPLTRDTPTWMASITKSLTGVLVMQFVDRGYVELDVPIDRYLPELKTASPCPLTLRLLLTHTSGLSWAGEWASDWNPSMENEVAEALPYLVPGREFKYHRAGYALATKVIERISGKTVPQLFEEMLLTPLGMSRSTVDNSYGGLYAPAFDLARFGQMLLHHGTYGSHQFLSERAWKAMLPAPLQIADTNPQKSWGIGLAPFGRDGLSNAAFGHSAASGAIFRVDPERELVIIIGRNETGPDEKQNSRFASRFIQALTTALDRRTTHE